MEPYWKVIEQIVKESDLVLEILDARMIESSRNEELEKMIKKIKRPVIVVINKSDLVSSKELDMGMDKLRKEGVKDALYISCRKKSSIRNLMIKIRKVFNMFGKREKIEDSKKSGVHREAEGKIVVGVVGYPNVGKSSIINALSFKKKAKVTVRAGTTHGAHWIASSGNIKFIDTPGVIPMKYMDKTKLDLIGAREVGKIKDKEIIAAKIINLFLDKNKEILEKKYGIKIKKGDDAYEIIEDLGRVKKHLKKKGVVDEQRTSTLIIRDWQQGKLKMGG
ncbi:MAG: GTPase [Nanoarchaeota archaeon]|nr:50S ribosome-binding GTPase [Nanoarchaeota archaeon]